MLAETHALLADFYEPFNREAAAMLGWSNLQWGSSQSAQQAAAVEA